MLGKIGIEKWVQQLYLHTKGMGMILLNFLACLGFFCSFFCLLQADDHLSWQCKHSPGLASTAKAVAKQKPI